MEKVEEGSEEQRIFCGDRDERQEDLSSPEDQRGEENFGSSESNQKDEESKANENTEEQGKEQKQKEKEKPTINRGIRCKLRAEPIMKPSSSKKRRMLDKRRKQKRVIGIIRPDDPRYRGVPKIKRIRKRKNKPKAISQKVKIEAQVKREEDEYIKKVQTRGRTSKSNIKRRMKEYPKFSKKSGDVKLQDNVKLQDVQESQQYQRQLSLSVREVQQNEDKQTTRKRVSRKQRQRQRQQDIKKVQTIIKTRVQRQTQHIQSMIKVQRHLLSKFGHKLMIEIDPNCKHYSQYRCKRGEIQKSGKLFCQIYNKFPVPANSKHFFHFKIIRLTFQSITVGVITQSNFQNQYSRDKPNCICFDAYSHSIYVEGRKTQLDVEVKLNDIVLTVVDVKNSSMHWYVNHDLIGQCKIPEHLAKVPLYPYMEISNKWIKLRINDFQQ